MTIPEACQLVLEAGAMVKGGEIFGLRPGEKIYEELLAYGENTKSTYNEKIMIANVKKLNHQLVLSEIREMSKINKELDFHKMVIKMKEIVPEFISNNSEFEVLNFSNKTKKLSQPNEFIIFNFTLSYFLISPQKSINLYISHLMNE